jgi:hypothetical protein
VARLSDPVAGGGDALFVAYRSPRLGTCFDLKVAADLETSRSPLQCSARDATCGRLCVVTYTPDASDEGHDLVAGVVSDEATSVRLIFADGEATELPLVQISPDVARRRLFMTRLGDRKPVSIEGVRDGHRLAVRHFP